MAVPVLADLPGDVVDHVVAFSGLFRGPPCRALRASINRVVSSPKLCARALREARGDDALVVAAKRGHRDLFDAVWALSADASCKLVSAAFLAAAQHGNTDVLKAMVEDDDAYEMIDFDDFGVALKEAAARGHADVVSWMIKEYLCDLCLCDESYEAALSAAASRGHPDVVRLMLEAGVVKDVDKADAAVATALTACEDGDIKPVRKLLDSGFVRRAALVAVLASDEMSFDILDELERYGLVTRDVRDSALIMCRDEFVAKMLIKQGVSFAARLTAALGAWRREELWFAKFLACGAFCISCHDAAHLARQYGEIEFAKFLDRGDDDDDDDNDDDDD